MRLGLTFRRTLLVGLLLFAGGALAGNDLEAKVKSAFLIHLTKFVEWPALSDDAFRICVRGADGVADLMQGLGNRPIRNLPLKIETEGDPSRCQMLYIGRDWRNPGELLGKVRKSAVLTVGDQEDFPARGGMVGFYSDAGRIKLEINPEAARAANLRVSAKLLELARPVGSTKRE
jgi:hypothetical protein